MGQPVLANNVWATLASAATAAQPTLTLTAGQGARFPTIAAGNWTYATVFDANNDVEIVKVTAVSGDVLSVVRGVDGTVAQAWGAAARVECRFNAAYITDMVAFVNASLDAGGYTMTGPLYLSADPVSPNDLVTKNYADTALFKSSRSWMAPVGYPMVQCWTANLISLGWDGAQIQTTVDGTSEGYLWHSGNFTPGNYAPLSVNCNWGTGIAEFGALDVANKTLDVSSPWVTEGMRMDANGTLYPRYTYLKNT